MTVEKPIPKLLHRAITSGAGSAMKQLEFREIICSFLQAREKSRVQGPIGFGFACLWLKKKKKDFYANHQLELLRQSLTFAFEEYDT